MKKRVGKNRVLWIYATITLLCSAAGATSGSELMQQGLYAEEIEGDLPAAIAVYEKIINDATASEKHIGQALYRQGMCYLRLGDKAQAVAVFLKALDANNDKMVKAFIEQDENAFASCWLPDAICMIDDVPVISGEEQMRAVFLDASANASMRDLERLNRQVWMSGDYLYESGMYLHQFSVPGRQDIVSSCMPFVTVWKKQPDDTWKRAVEIWSERPMPAAATLDKWRKQVPTDVPFINVNSISSDPELDAGKAIKHVADMEKTFHDYFLSDDVGAAVGMYAKDARLLSMGQDWSVGREQIRAMILKGMQEADLVNIKRDTISSGGDGKMIYVVNCFHWQFKLPATGDQIHDVFGKGLHVWQRQPGGQWEILIDINNMSPPPGVNP